MSNYDYLLIEKYMLMVDEKFDARDYYDGRTLLEEVLNIDPKAGKAHAYLGWYYYVLHNDYVRADRHYALALESTPEFAGIYHNYCIVLLNMRKYDAMIDLANKGLDVPGVDKAGMLNEIARGYEGKGIFKLAKVYYTRALKAADSTDAIKVIKGNLKRLKIRMRIAAPWYVAMW